MLREAYITRQFYTQTPTPVGPYHLSMCLSNRAFMYAIFTSGFKNIIELAHIELAEDTGASGQMGERVPFLIQNYFLHQKKFEKVNIMVLNNEFTMAPEAYADNNDGLKSVLKFSAGRSPVKTLVSHRIKGVCFCFPPDHELFNYLEKTFVNASIRHAGAVGIHLLFSQHSLSASQVFLNLHDGFMELGMKDNNGLQFYNIFNYQNNEDILYYLLFAMEQFRLDPMLVKLSVAGQIQVNDELVKMLKKYVRQLAFCVGDPSLVLGEELSTLPQHYYFSLLNQHLCEL